MAADLDRIFTALREQADGAVLGAPATVRRYGERRRRRRLLATGLSVLLISGIVVGLLGRVPHASPRPIGPPTPVPTVEFSPLRAVGTPIAMASDGHVFSLAEVYGDRAFVGGRTPAGHLVVTAIDLATGASSWTRDVGAFGDWNGLQAWARGVAVLGEHDDGTSPDHVWMLLDPATGAVRWQTGFDALAVEPFDDVVVIPSTSDHLLRGLDWRTGQPLWTLPFPDGTEFLRSYGSDPRIGQPRPGSAELAGDNRLFLIDPTGTLRRYDARTGELRETRPAVAPPASATTTSVRYLAYGDELYALGEARASSIWVTDLARPGPPRQIFAGPTEIVRLDDLLPCGADRVCAQAQTADRHGAVLAIDVTAGQVRWQRLIGPYQAISTLGDRVLSQDGTVIGPDGTTLLAGNGQALPVAAGSALLMVRGADPAEMDVFGVSMLDGSKVPLGPIPTPAGACAANGRYLVCPTAAGIREWQFAR
jgi:molecular chaperone HscA